MKNKFWPIKFDGITVHNWLKDTFWISYYKWDETPYGLTITIFGINFDFLVGSYE